MSTRQDAKQAVQDIAKEYGVVPEEVLGGIERHNPEWRRVIEEGMLAKDKLAAHSIKTLAKNLYGSDARFVFELLQNADDNRFERATAGGALPSIIFQVHPGRIIVECNEDGFTKRDLKAICSVGQSTKSGSHGYIGAKGIGFKSVFIAAWKVDILSGHFSFYFKHQKDDLGLGMVTPVWVDDVDVAGGKLPGPSPVTRMTLHLHDKGDMKELEHLRGIIFKQLADLQPTCLLFLRNLRHIQVTFYGEDGRMTSSRDFRRIGDDDDHRTTLESVVTSQHGETTTQTKHFHVTRHMASNLSKSQNRELSGSEEASKTFSTAEVVLAFPLTERSIPVVEKQEVFAFLPVEESVFKFLIQSDFDTTASRQSIMTTSQRNVNLLDGIADAFLKAVLEFCEHEGLCYTWPLFLPDRGDKPSQFWSGLKQRITQRITTTPILRSRHSDRLRGIDDVFILRDFAKDEDDEPLLDCQDRDPYLSDQYPSESWEALRDYGLESVGLGLMLDLLQSDLASASSKMRAKSTSRYWHSATAHIFFRCFETDYQNGISRLKKLSLLPLAGGAWVSADSGGEIYFPTTVGGLAIPPGVDLRVLDSSAVENPYRCKLFKRLGAVNPSVSLVRSIVLLSYSSSSIFRRALGVAASKALLGFLYLAYSQEQSPSELEKVCVHLHDGSIAYPHRQDVYLPGDHAYGPEALLGPDEGGAPGLKVAMLHPAYLDEVPVLPESKGRPSWKEWLLRHLAIREQLRIVNRDNDSFSDIWSYVAEHRPEELLGLLEHVWHGQGARIQGSSDLVSALRQTDATELCEASWQDSNVCFRLDQTWLPLPDLQQERLRFMGESDPFPFLELKEAGSAEQMTTRWGFMEQFGVGIRAGDGIDFLLAVLYWTVYSRDETSEGSVLDIYCTIEARLLGLESAQRQGPILKIRNLVQEEDLILIPSSDDEESMLGDCDSCLWEGPPGMTTRHAVKCSYIGLCGANSERLDMVGRFFKQTLEIPDASPDDIVRELRSLREESCDDFDRISGLYRYLSRAAWAASPTRDEIRLAFESKPLIFVASKGGNSRNGWYKTGECLWSSTADIQGRVTLSGQYEEDLEAFFLEVLGVKTLTVQMVYDELKQTTAECLVERVKNTIESFSSLLRAGTSTSSAKALDPGPLLQVAFFPVRYPDGSVVLVSAKIDFAIVDRQHLSELFQGRIKLLDYCLEDVRRLAPFFQWAGLEHRYLSRCTRQITSASGGVTRPVRLPSRGLKPKAHAVLRIAATFNSPRYEADRDGLYQLLRTAEVIETDGISTVLSISQDGQCTEVEQASGGDVHIDETSASPSSSRRLRLLVPSNKRKQEACYLCALPENFAGWLMRGPTTQIQDPVEEAMVVTLTSVLNASAAEAVINRILDGRGIVNVPIRREAETEDEAEETDVDESEVEIEEDEKDSAAAAAARLRNDGTPSTASSSSRRFITPDESFPASDGGDGSGSDDGNSDHARGAGSTWLVRSTNSSSMPRPALALAAPRPSDEDREYLRILNGVLKAARNASFPSRGAFAMGEMRDALLAVGDYDAAADKFSNFDGFDGPNPIGSRFRSSTRLERDRKIGAAGELYVFELLSRLKPALSGWGRGNWQSTIRKYVTLHPDYADMPPWHGAETADITYDDTEGDLTALLVDRGFLDEDVWEDARPKYFIEVKSTTGPCDVPFYMSKGQYQRMRDVHAKAGRRHEVYMILRVFHVDGKNTGMSVYVDPEQLRLDDSLAFTAETWSVVPGPSA